MTGPAAESLPDLPSAVEVQHAMAPHAQAAVPRTVSGGAPDDARLASPALWLAAPARPASQPVAALSAPVSFLDDGEPA